MNAKHPTLLPHQNQYKTRETRSTPPKRTALYRFHERCSGLNRRKKAKFNRVLT